MTSSPTARKVFFESSPGTLAALSLVLAGPVLLVVWTFEPPFVLPALSVLFFAAALLAVMMAISTRTGRNTKNLNLWDIAGGLVITGCAASVMGEPEQVTQLFEHLFETRTSRRD